MGEFMKIGDHAVEARGRLKALEMALEAVEMDHETRTAIGWLVDDIGITLDRAVEKFNTETHAFTAKSVSIKGPACLV